MLLINKGFYKPFSRLRSQAGGRFQPRTMTDLQLTMTDLQLKKLEL
jgi:hypothetical protein